MHRTDAKRTQEKTFPIIGEQWNRKKMNGGDTLCEMGEKALVLFLF